MREIDPLKTKRAASWKLYIDAPMPMVTIFKTLDITNLVKLKHSGYQLNMLMCYCIGLAASGTEELYLLSAGKKMFEFDRLGISVIVLNQNGGINSCDIPFTPELEEFRRNYSTLTREVNLTCRDREIKDHMIIGTSALVKYDIDGVVNMYSGIFNNPFLIWGRYREDRDAVRLQISFQFHHVQMDGMEACRFLEDLQKSVNETADRFL